MFAKRIAAFVLAGSVAFYLLTFVGNDAAEIAVSAFVGFLASEAVR